MHLFRLIRTPFARALGLLALGLLALGLLALGLGVGFVGLGRPGTPGPSAAPTGAHAEAAKPASSPAEGERPPAERAGEQSTPEVRDVPEAKRLLELARSDDPLVVEAALEKIPTVYAARSTRKPGPDAELERVLAAKVRSERPTTIAAALKAARVSLMASEPGDTVTVAIAELAAPEKPAERRHAALEALNLLRPDRRAPHVLAAFERALDAKEPELVSLALLALSESGRSLDALSPDDRTRFAGRILKLLGHYDPGCRGRALAVLADVPSLVELTGRMTAAERALVDREAYVRARAADLLSRCGEPTAIHRLIEHVADLAVARYELRGFTLLDGTPGSLLHEVPGRPRVAEAALFAVRSLSERVEGAPPLSVSLGDRDRSEAAVLESAERARSWYRAHAAAIPRAARLSAPGD